MASIPIPEAAIVERATVDPQRVEEAALNALQTQRQLFYDGLAAIYDMVTAADFCGRGLASSIVTALLNHAARSGALHAFLQVNADNAPARAVYARFGFGTRYGYHYRARCSECF